MISKLKDYLKNRKIKRYNKLYTKEMNRNIGLSSRYYTKRDLVNMSDSAFQTIIPVYNNHIINVVWLEYKKYIEELYVVVYFNDNGKEDYLWDIDVDKEFNHRKHKRYGRACKFLISVDDMNYYQGFDNIIQLKYKEYLDVKLKEEEELRKYDRKEQEELKRYI